MSVCVSVDVSRSTVDVGLVSILLMLVRVFTPLMSLSMCVHRQIISRFPGHTTLRMVTVAGT